MESVGPVDIGDECALPDLSRDEQGEVRGPTLRLAAVKESLFALSTGCGSGFMTVHKPACGIPITSMNSDL
jgi:hypothetical protein